MNNNMNNNMHRQMNRNMENRMDHRMEHRMEHCMDQCMDRFLDNNMDQKSLMNKINIISFAINDCTLYLDTHPCDEAALTCINEWIPIRRVLLDKYAQCFTPLTIDSVQPSNKWEWASGPMPWEGGCK